MVEEAPTLVEQLRKFPALKRLDVSFNPEIDCAFVSLIVKALSGKAVLLHRHIYVHKFAGRIEGSHLAYVHTDRLITLLH